MKQPIADLGSIRNIDAIEEMAHVGSWFWNLQTGTRTWSNECYRIYGLPPGDRRLNPETILSFIHPDDREAALEAVQFAIENKQSYSHEKRLMCPDGSLRYVVANGKAIYNEKGVPLTMLGTLQDITGLKETESLYKREKDKLNQYINACASIFVIINADHTIQLINPKGCEILGYARHEIIGKNWFHNCIPKKEIKALSRLFDMVIDGETEPPEVHENWVVAKGKRRKLIRWHNTLIKDDDGTVTGLISSGIDISEKRKAERKLMASQVKNRAILNAIPDLIIIKDVQGKILEVMASDPTLFVAPVEELIGKYVPEVLPEKAGKKIMMALKSVHRTKQPETIEIQLPNLGVSADFETRLVPYGDNKILSVSRNITKSRALAKTLNVRNRALEAAGNGIIIADALNKEMPIIYSNNAFSRITGYKQSEVLGKNCRFLQKDDRDQADIKNLAIAIQKGEPCKVVLRNYRKDGALFWNELTITPLYNKEQELTHFIGVQNDVTELQRTKKQLEEYAEKLEQKITERTKEMEATLQKLVETNLNLEDQIQITQIAEDKAKQSQALFTAIAKNFPKGLIVVFNADFELVYVEGEELKRVNLKKSDFEGRCVDDIHIFSKKQIENIKEDVIKTISGKSLSFELNFRKDVYAVNATPLRYDAEGIVWALFVYNNITEQKNIQEELAKALKVEQELNELKSRFISMASHEFRTPLSAILSSAILIEKQNEPGKEERRSKHVARIRTHVKHLVVILNDFLSLSKLEEGRVQSKPQPIELIQFCKIVVDEMEGTKKEGQSIKLSYSQVEIPVFLDPKLLHHILVNLLSNALKYSDEGQQIQLELEHIKAFIIFKVTDQGMGIPEQEQENLFERFFRAENVTNIQGTGLGLHIVKQYTELMQGAVSFISKSGQGSTFTVKLPLNLHDYEKNTIN